MKVRSLRVRWLALLAFAVSCTIVLTALPGRREAVRTATDAYIAMRPLTAAEAAFLIGTDAATVTIDGADAMLLTSSYVVRDADGSFRSVSASWENYRSVYRVRRDAVEAVLRRPIRSYPLRMPADRVSFSSDHVPWYVVVEIGFLTAWMTVLALVLRRIRRISALLPVLWLFLIVPMLFVRFYSPAFLDTDFFHQRVVLETIALWALVAASPLTVPAGVSLVVWIVLAIAERIGPNARRYAVATMMVAGLAFAGFLYGAWRVEASRCEADLESALGRLRRQPWMSALERNHGSLGGDLFGARCIAAMETCRAAASVVTAQGEDPRRELIVVVPNFGGREELLFLWRNQFPYADLRSMRDLDNLTDGDALASARRSGRYARGFREAFFDGHVCARSAHVEGRDVVVAVRGEPSPISAMFAW